MNVGLLIVHLCVLYSTMVNFGCCEVLNK